jgi:hypothetical protein
VQQHAVFADIEHQLLQPILFEQPAKQQQAVSTAAWVVGRGGERSKSDEKPRVCFMHNGK